MLEPLKQTVQYSAMNAYRYVQSAEEAAWLLQGLLSEEESARLRDTLRSMTEEGWRNWDNKFRSEASKFLQATPEQRAKTKKWQEEPLRFLLALSAYRQARLAAEVLTWSNGVTEGTSYRSAIASAASTALQVLDAGSWVWPFAGASPFPEWPRTKTDGWVENDPWAPG